MTDNACPHVDSCALYGFLDCGDLTQLWKTLYCHNSTRFGECARFLKSAQGLPVPLTLLPNGSEMRVPKSR